MNFEALKGRFADFISPKRRDSDFYASRQMEEIETPMLKISKDLFPHIQNAEYSMIVSDDNSGRIPSMVWRNVINTIYDIQGKDQITMAYIRGERKGDELFFHSQIVEVLKELALEAQRKMPNTRVLISTEHIGDGVHVGSIGRFLEEAGIPYDVVSISTILNPGSYKNGEYALSADTRIFSAERWEGNPISNLNPIDELKARNDVPKMAKLLLLDTQLNIPQII